MVAAAIGFIGPYGLNVPHLYPRGNEFLIVVSSERESRFFVDIPLKGELDGCGAVNIGKVDIDEETDELIEVYWLNDQKDYNVWALTVSTCNAEDILYALVLSQIVRDDGKTRYRRFGLLSIVSPERMPVAKKDPRHIYRGMTC